MHRLCGIAAAQPQRHEGVEREQEDPEHMGRIRRVRVAADQCRHGEDAGQDAQRGMKQRDGAVRPTGLLDALVDVFAVGQEDVLTAEEPQDEGEPDVEEHEDQRGDDDDDRHPLDEQPYGEDEHGRSDPVAAGVTEEGLGFAEVEGQEADGCSGQGQGEEGEVLLTDPRADEGVPAGSDDRPFGDIPVESVDEVHGIDGSDPDDGEGHAVGDPLSGEHCDDRTEEQREDDLPDEAASWTQRIEVVTHPDRRIAPSEHEESDGKNDPSDAEDSVFVHAPHHGEHGGHGDAAADGDAAAAHRRQRV